MKNLALLLALSLLISLDLFAQVSIGVKVGGALAGQANEGIGLANSNDQKITYLAGLSVPISLSQKFDLQPELLYSSKGFRTLIISSRSVSERYNLHYLSVPIMLRYHLLDKLTVALGPEVSYLLGAATSLNTVSFSGTPSIQEQFLSSYKDLDIALNVGVGYSLSDKWSLNLRYNMGLYDVSEDFTVSIFGRDEPLLISAPTYNRAACNCR